MPITYTYRQLLTQLSLIGFRTICRIGDEIFVARDNLVFRLFDPENHLPRKNRSAHKHRRRGQNETRG